MVTVNNVYKTQFVSQWIKQTSPFMIQDFREKRNLGVMLCYVIYWWIKQIYYSFDEWIILRII